ncbi:hydroxymethylbilane synthase [Altererythrobacter sp. GH1-8]|uniref:hydroxymethylbilane synthase n=1 Tax=Altererythrobacter sp. GH1-8 TaxID=3349333 RepID=UPI00374DC4D6
MSEKQASSPILRLGTRESPLAMAQAVETRERLCRAHGWAPDQVELVTVKASGDKILDRPLADIGGKALWTKELDQWLGEGHVDACVHSMKDVETIRPEAFVIGAILPRADRRDVLVGADSIAAIPHGARVGTSAPRRAAQLLNHRPDCEVVGIRGNVATRLAKLEAGEADVTFLAAAGLARLGQADVGTPLDCDNWVPAAAQGAIGIECRADDERVRELLAAIDDKASHAEVLADRALLAALGGNCHSSVAVDSRCEGTAIRMRAVVFSPDGRERVEGETAFTAHDENGPRELARDLLSRSSEAIRKHFSQPA